MHKSLRIYLPVWNNFKIRALENMETMEILEKIRQQLYLNHIRKQFSMEVVSDLYDGNDHNNVKDVFCENCKS